MADATLRQIFDRGLEQHRAGNLREAESCYRQVLAVQPKNADALHLLGVIAHQSGHRDAGVQLIHQAIASDPNRAEFYCTLGIFLAAAGQLDEAIPNYRKALAIHPTFADASSNFNFLISFCHGPFLRAPSFEVNRALVTGSSCSISSAVQSAKLDG